MDVEPRTYNWQPIPEAMGQRIELFGGEVVSGSASELAQRANTVLTAPSTLLMGEMVRISGTEVIFHSESLLDDDGTFEQFSEYESVYNQPHVVGRFMGCVALRETSGAEELGCEVSIETQTGGFLLAHIPLEGAQIEVDAPAEMHDEAAMAEAEAAANEQMLGESFRYLKEHVGEDGREAFAELEELIYGDVDMSVARTEAEAIAYHLRAVGIYSTTLLNTMEVAEDQEALRCLKFIIESSILDVGEDYDVVGLSSDTILKDGLLFAENVGEVRLRDVIFSGVKLYSAAFDMLKDKKIEADGTCTPALQFEVPETGEIFDIQLLRVSQLAGASFTEDDESHDNWRQRYDKFIQDQGRWAHG